MNEVSSSETDNPANPALPVIAPSNYGYLTAARFAIISAVTPRTVSHLHIRQQT